MRGTVFSQTHVFLALLASVGSCHNIITAPKAVSNLHWGTEAPGLAFGALSGPCWMAVRADNVPTHGTSMDLGS